MFSTAKCFWVIKHMSMSLSSTEAPLSEVSAGAGKKAAAGLISRLLRLQSPCKADSNRPYAKMADNLIFFCLH